MGELFVMPTPLMIRSFMLSPSPFALKIVNALAPGVNTMPLTSTIVPQQMLMKVALETSKVAVSAGPLGMVSGVQLSSSIQQIPHIGSVPVHVALSAKAVADAKSRNTSVGAAAHARKMLRRCRADRLIEILRNEFVALRGIEGYIMVGSFAWPCLLLQV